MFVLTLPGVPPMPQIRVVRVPYVLGSSEAEQCSALHYRALQLRVMFRVFSKWGNEQVHRMHELKVITC